MMRRRHARIPIMGLVHGAALRAGQDPRADGPRPLVQSHDLDGDVQRSAELPGNPPALPVLVLPLSDRPAVLARAPPSCAATWPRCARCWTRSTTSRRWTRWCWSGTAWAAWWPSCKPSRAATTTGTWPATSRCEQVQRRSRDARASCERPSSSSPILRSAASSPSPRRTAAARFPIETTQYLLGKLIRMPRGPGGGISRRCSATTRGCSSTARC